MFGLWNELFGFPVNSCDYENIECNKSYIPILNWDNDNEFVWSLGDPLEGGVDAKNISFSTKDVQKRPASVTKVDQALETLMDMIEDSKSTIKSFSFALNEDGETLEGTITYEDDSGHEYEKTASINIKDIVEGRQVITLKDVIADSVDADSGIFDSARIGGLDVTGDVVIEGNETVNGTVIMNSTLGVAGKATINGGADITGNLNVVADIESGEGGEIHGVSIETSGDATFGGDLTVTGDSYLSGNISSAGSASIGGALSVDSTATIGSDLTVGGDVTITGDETVSGAMSVTGATTIGDDLSVTGNLSVSGDTTLADDLTVNGSTHLKDVETDGSVDIDGTLRTTGAAVIGNGINVTGQVESDTVRTGEVIADEIRATTGVYLSQGGEAPDFVLQSEKGQPNGTAPLDVNGLVDPQYLPPVYTTAIVKMGTGVFSNSNTSTVVDADITSDSFVAISNYQDIVGDLTETISVGQLTVASNTTETGSYKYIIVNPIS